MSEFEMYDYLEDLIADYTDETLSVACQDEIDETPMKDQADHKFDGGGIETVNLSDNVWFEGTLQWPNGISKSDAGTIMDLYIRSDKADFKRRSFYWAHPTDGHTYVIKFRGPLTRTRAHNLPDYIKIPVVPIRVIGRKVEVEA